jgi:hypothetical protein
MRASQRPALALAAAAAMAGCAHGGTPADTASVTLQQLAMDLGIVRPAALPDRLDLCTEVEKRDGLPRLYCPERLLVPRWQGKHLGAVVERVDTYAWPYIWQFSVQLEVDLDLR